MNKRYIITGVFCSLLLNVLLIGVIVGYKLSDSERVRHPEGRKGIISFVHTLPEKKSQIFLDRIQVSKKKGGVERREIKALRKAVVTMLIADNFDSKAFEQALEKIHGMRSNIKKNQMLVLVSLAEELTLQERKELSKYLMRDRAFRKEQQSSIRSDTLPKHSNDKRQ